MITTRQSNAVRAVARPVDERATVRIGRDRPRDQEPPSPSPCGERVRARVGDYLSGHDPRTILADVVVGDAAEIARTVVDRCVEPPGWRVRHPDAHAAGLLHWLRADHLAEPAARAEHGRALAFFLLLFRRYPDAVPASELAALAGAAAGYTGDQLDGPAFWAGSATGAIRAYDDAPDPALPHGAILLFRFAAIGTDPTDPYHATYATALIRALRRLPGWAADPRVADEVLAYARRCVDAKPPDDTDRVVYVAQLVDVLTSIYLATGDSPRIDEAVTIGTSQLDGPTPVHRIAIHTATATALHIRYIDTDALPDLHRVIELERQAVELADAMPDSRADLLSALADSLVSLYLRTEEDAVGREAVEIQRRAADTASPGTEQHAQLSCQLAGTLFARFQQTRDRADFDAAVRAAQVGSRVRDIDRADVARRHGLVALTCHLRYDLTAEVSHLAGAFQTAGFRHVVATQWVVNDRRARAAVAALYRVVTEPGHAPNASGVPAALRQVLRAERDANPDRPWLWAPYVHFGP